MPPGTTTRYRFSKLVPSPQCLIGSVLNFPSLAARILGTSVILDPHLGTGQNDWGGVASEVDPSSAAEAYYCVRGTYRANPSPLTLIYPKAAAHASLAPSHFVQVLFSCGGASWSIGTVSWHLLEIATRAHRPQPSALNLSLGLRLFSLFAATSFFPVA
jgi:hypothetical protein